MCEKVSAHPAPLAKLSPARSQSSTSRLRVVRIIDRLNVGGPSKHVVWLTAGLTAAGFDTELIAGSLAPGESDMSYFARAAGVRPLVINQLSREIRLRDVVVIAKLLWRFLKLRPDIIHTHKAKAGAVGRVAAMIYKWATPSILRLRPRQCRVVHTYHGHIFHGYYGRARTRLFIGIEQALARLCTDRVIVLSDQQSREISGRYRIGRPEQFRIIPLGLDLDEDLEEVQGGASGLREELGIADDQTAIGIVGRLCEVKNHGMFLDTAVRILRDPSARARFVIVGDGHLRKELEQQSMRLGISDAVRFTGFRKDAASLYAAMDIVALTSLNEGTPLTLAEAMRRQRPVAATEVGGVEDLMGERRSSIDGFTVWDHGVTAPSGDVEAFARALRFLIEHPELRNQMGESGRAFVTMRMSKERLLSDIERLYNELSGPALRVPSQSRSGAFAQ
jgi:glycosyltransferase involved in cell wall biosynthesis